MLATRTYYLHITGRGDQQLNNFKSSGRAPNLDNQTRPRHWRNTKYQENTCDFIVLDYGFPILHQ